MVLDNNNSKDQLRKLQALTAGGDEAAFHSLYSFYEKSLFSFAFKFLKSRELAEEVVEDVFIKLWRNRESLVHIQNLRVYLYSATKNHCLNSLARESKRVITQPLEIANAEAASRSSSPHDLLITSEVMQSMKNAIEDLPPRCKAIFKLVREDGLRYKDVAEILQISVNTIDAQMAIAVKRICTSLGVERIRKNTA